MVDYEIGARLELKNLAAFKAGMATAGRSVDDVGDEAAGATAKMALMGNAARKVGRGLITGLKYGAVGATVALGALAGASIKGAVEAQKVAAQTTAVIKSTGGVANVSAKNVNSLANEVMSYSGISDEAIASGQNLLLTFTNIR